MSILNNLIPSLAQTPATQNGNGSELAHAIKPVFEIKEAPDAYGVTVYLPGVAKDGLDLTVEEGQVRIVGRRAWQQPDGWTTLYRESHDAPFELVLTHDNVIDADKVVAELRD